MAEPDAYSPLTSDDLAEVVSSESRIAIRTRNFMDLAAEVAKISFAGAQKEWSKFNNAWGPTWAGTYGTLGGFEAWIGLDASAWSEWGASPIWLQLFGKNKFQQIEIKLSSQPKIAHFRHANGEQLCVPVLVGSGDRDEVLQQCCAQIEKIKQRLLPVEAPFDPNYQRKESDPYYSIIREPVTFD